MLKLYAVVSDSIGLLSLVNDRDEARKTAGVFCGALTSGATVVLPVKVTKELARVARGLIREFRHMDAWLAIIQEGTLI